MTHALCSTSEGPMHSDHWWMDGQMIEIPPATVQLHSPLQEYIQPSLRPYSGGDSTTSVGPMPLNHWQINGQVNVSGPTTVQLHWSVQEYITSCL